MEIPEESILRVQPGGLPVSARPPNWRGNEKGALSENL